MTNPFTTILLVAAICAGILGAATTCIWLLAVGAAVEIALVVAMGFSDGSKP